MKCILLAAGYATRLYPLTKDMPKSLLKVGNKTILEHILEKIKDVSCIDEIILVSNHLFYNKFKNFLNFYNYNKNISVVNDGTISNENRLGAIYDLYFALNNQNINDDILVLASDNLFDFSLKEFVDYFYSINFDCITVNEINNLQDLKKTGVAQISEKGIVTSFEEKPQFPKSNLAVPPFYIYKRETLPLFKQYLDEKNNPDAPGNFISWLCNKKEIYTYKFNGKRYDIGTLESYKNVNKIFK
jgi:glucose-1-phosphate thymidylyltransferase